MRSLTLVLLAICIYGLAGKLKLLLILKRFIFIIKLLNIASMFHGKKRDDDELPWANDDDLHDVLKSHDQDALSEYLANHRLTDEQRDHVNNFVLIESENNHNNQGQTDEK